MQYEIKPSCDGPTFQFTVTEEFSSNNNLIEEYMEYAICSARGCDLRSEIYVFADDCEDEEQENGNCHRYPFKEEQ